MACCLQQQLMIACTQKAKLNTDDTDDTDDTDFANLKTA